MRSKDITIIGAGLCGTALAIKLAQRGYKVNLFEKRPDLRKVTQDAGRSINLALSDRGLKALRLIGLEEKALKMCIPMKGRMIHNLNKPSFLSQYSGRNHEYINSISRPGLNALLLGASETYPNISLNFNTTCTAIDTQTNTASFYNQDTQKEQTITNITLFGTDGAGSVVRRALQTQHPNTFKTTTSWLTHGYKELEIPSTTKKGFAIEKEALHIWPRGGHMLIALPNLDGSFTVTLFAPLKGPTYSFEALTTPEHVLAYFKTFYPSAYKVMPDLLPTFFENNTGTLGTVRCNPWHHKNRIMLMGDAAHAIVPFYGQGMNASLEDVVVFDEILEKHNENLTDAFIEFSANRKKDTDAIADLALDNFEEMKAHTADPLFQQKRKLEIAFETQFPQIYFSKYSKVTFQEQLPYSQALKEGRAQDKAILSLLKAGQLPDTLPIKEALKKVQTATTLYL